VLQEFTFYEVDTYSEINWLKGWCTIFFELCKNKVCFSAATLWTLEMIDASLNRELCWYSFPLKDSCWRNQILEYVAQKWMVALLQFSKLLAPHPVSDDDTHECWPYLLQKCFAPQIRMSLFQISRLQHRNGIAVLQEFTSSQVEKYSEINWRKGWCTIFFEFFKNKVFFYAATLWMLEMIAGRWIGNHPGINFRIATVASETKFGVCCTKVNGRSVAIQLNALPPR